jgi:hypothetical protein
VERQAQPADYRDQDPTGDQAGQQQVTRDIIETAARDQDCDHAGEQHDIRERSSSAGQIRARSEGA